MPHAVFISPHFDDVAFSCGGTLGMLAQRGWEVTLCTVFTRPVPAPTGFALACQLDKGLGAEVDYLALRRAEDDAAARALAATRLHRLDLPEAPHRGYESATALFGEYTAADDIAPQLERSLFPLLETCDAAFAPQALGSHVDHRRVRDAVIRQERVGGGSRTYWYRDLPYAMKHPAARSTAHVEALPERAFALSNGAVALKLEASARYATQLGFQFGDEFAMRAALAAFARSEGARLGSATSVEAFRSRYELP